MVIIHKYLNPRCFKKKKFDPRRVCYYFANRTAWMTQNVFHNVAKQWNTKFKRERRQVVMLMDNATGHMGKETEELEGFTVFRMSNILFVFLPANTTSLIQPLDQGIIQCLKVRCGSHPN